MRIFPQLFEGFKAYRGVDDKIRLFRPESNMERMNNSAIRAGLPSFRGEELIKCICRLISIDQEWVPHSLASSLYIRPTLIGIDVSAVLLTKVIYDETNVARALLLFDWLKRTLWLHFPIYDTTHSQFCNVLYVREHNKAETVFLYCLWRHRRHQECCKSDRCIFQYQTIVLDKLRIILLGHNHMFSYKSNTLNCVIWTSDFDSQLCTRAFSSVKFNDRKSDVTLSCINHELSNRFLSLYVVETSNLFLFRSLLLSVIKYLIF